MMISVTAINKYFNDIFFFFLLRDTSAAYGSFRAMGQIIAAAAGLHHSHSNNTEPQPYL